MRWVIYTAVALIAVVGLAAAIGYILPVDHQVSRSAEFNQPPHVIYDVISDLPGYAAWWPENETRVEVVEAVRPSKFMTRIVGETAFGGTWTMEIVPIPSGSRLTITERGEIYNPIFRTLAKFVFGHTRTMDNCLTALRHKLP